MFWMVLICFLMVFGQFSGRMFGHNPYTSIYEKAEKHFLSHKSKPALEWNKHSFVRITRFSIQETLKTVKTTEQVF